LLTGLLALPALTTLADTPPGKKDGPAKPITVPFELLKSGHMAVQVKVNGKGPYRLIFDTGAPLTLVNNKLAREAGLLEGAPKPAFTLFGSMGETRIKTLEVGDQKAEDVAAVVMDHPTVELIANHVGPLHGIVGFPFFARFKMTIDYQAKTLTFEPNGYKPPDVMKAMLAALMGPSAPIVLSPAGQWGVLVGKESGDEDEGVDLKEVIPGSAAARAGLKRGDRLLTVDGRWTDSVKDLYEAAGRIKAGTTVVARIKRGGKEMEVKVTPAAGM
jgi:hypothetical protein